MSICHDNIIYNHRPVMYTTIKGLPPSPHEHHWIKFVIVVQSVSMPCAILLSGMNTFSVLISIHLGPVIIN